MVRKAGYPDYITALKPKTKRCKPFIVADTETVMVNNNHVPYAAGFLVVQPGKDVGAMPDYEIETYFTEDDLPYIPEFLDRSDHMLLGFLERLAVVADRTKIRTVYFHNFSRFDGILLLKYYASHGDKYSVKALIRNNRLYEFRVIRGDKVVLRFRDSLTLLPASLNKLAKALCPELGTKGSIPHDDITVETLRPLKKQLLPYMKQDIRLLGGILVKAQSIYWSQFKVDIVDCLTLSALAMKIFRTSFYDVTNWPIHIPNRNEDKFIRRGYYGGHSDSYIPHGDNLYHYDVNSLYPFIMKSFRMPGGKPVWHGNLEDQDLSNLFGFIEAYVVCPPTISRPFLPYRDPKTKTLIFPTGKFVGVYYSEELKYAKELGYDILPLQGYMFEEKETPMGNFVVDMYSQRLEAKKTGDEAMSFVYKTLMNSLYGRFGINPESTTTEVCDRERYDILTQKENLIFGNKLSEQYYIVSYHKNTVDADDSEWDPPRISAVQLAAAITACARIHMYKYISRDDCFYTDTDSAILGSPLPEEETSSIELGKLKLEHKVRKGIFLAPKSYYEIGEDGKIILKHKGAAKYFVTPEWFESQLVDIMRKMQVTVESHFRIDWHTLTISKKETHVSLGIQVGTKRDPVYDSENVLINTIPKDVLDLGGQDLTILKYELRKVQEELYRKEREYAGSIPKDQFNELQERLIDKEAALSQATKDQKVIPKKVTKKVTKKGISRKDQEIAGLNERVATLESELAKQSEVIAIQRSEFESQLRNKDVLIASLLSELAKRDEKLQSTPAESPIVKPTQVSQKWQGISSKPKVPNKPVVQPPKYTPDKLQGPSKKPNKPSGYNPKKVKPPPKGNDTS